MYSDSGKSSQRKTSEASPLIQKPKTPLKKETSQSPGQKHWRNQQKRSNTMPKKSQKVREDEEFEDKEPDYIDMTEDSPVFIGDTPNSYMNLMNLLDKEPEEEKGDASPQNSVRRSATTAKSNFACPSSFFCIEELSEEQEESSRPTPKNRVPNDDEFFVDMTMKKYTPEMSPSSMLRSRNPFRRSTMTLSSSNFSNFARDRKNSEKTALNKNISLEICEKEQAIGKCKEDHSSLFDVSDSEADDSHQLGARVQSLKGCPEPKLISLMNSTTPKIYSSKKIIFPKK